MTVWTNRQITQVQCSSTVMEIDNEWTRDGERMMSVFDTLAQRLISHVRAFFVGIHPDDVAFHVDKQDLMRDRTTLVATWKPENDVIKFVGGANDGEVLKYRRAGDALLVPNLAAAESLSGDQEPVSVSEYSWEVYESTGWDETHRHWIYTPRRSHGVCEAEIGVRESVSAQTLPLS